MQKEMLRLGAILGLLCTVGPFAVDMYLPALPEIAASLDSSISTTQMTLTAYFITFGIAQLVYGPLSDQVGRKVPLYAGLAIFVFGSAGCAAAPSMEWLIGFRALQGLGAAAVMVIPRAIIRDKLTGTAATRLMATVMLVVSISPMLAPLAGSGVIAIASWRVIFVVLCVAALLGLLVTAFLLEETLPASQRAQVNATTLWRGVGHLLADKTFMLLTFIGGFGMASFFVFLASASFVYTGQYGLTPTEFSFAFAANAIGFFTASQFAATLGERHGMERVIWFAVIGFAASTLALLMLVLLGADRLGIIITMLLLANACLGLVIPSAMVLALDQHGEIAGLASSLGGTLQMLAGGITVVLVGPFFDGSALPMVAAIAICGTITFILTYLAIGRGSRPRRREPEMATP